jgi:hypothetical protein
MTPAIYRFAYSIGRLYWIQAVYIGCVRSLLEHGHLNLDVLVLHEPTPTETEEVEGF